MGLSAENVLKLKFLLQDGHEADFIRSFIKIVDKDTNTVPFLLTSEQKEFVDSLEKFNIVLKSRQLGLSVVTVALAIRRCIVYPNSNCMLVSHDQKSCNAIFDKLKQQFNSLPKWLKPKTLANNRQEIKMENGSKITCVCAGNKDVGRGDTLQLVHLSEFAFWKMPKKQLNSITQALSADGKLIIESTANGLNEFHDLYFQSKHGENSYKSFFFNWINGSTLFKKDYLKSAELYKIRNNGALTLEELDIEEIELKDMGASIEQLMWRRLKVANTGAEAFHQEYPSTDTEAFISTGANVFDNSRILSVEKAIKEEKQQYINKNNLIDLPIDLMALYGRSFFMYKIPMEGRRYVIGVDMSEGVGQDYSVLEILDKETGEQVAELYNNQIKPYQMVDLLYSLGMYFNYALLCIEKASGGHSVIEKLRYDKNYMNMVKYKTYDERNKERWNIGFDTNTKTKSMAINNLRENFEKGEIKINSIRVLHEMKIFSIKDNGTMGATGSGHDDTVMAMALAIQAIKYPYWYI